MRLDSTVFLSVIILVGSTGMAQSTGGWWDDVFEQKTVTLETVIENPVAFRGLEVSFVAQFNRLGSIENPFYTKFEKASFVNFSIWGDEAALWDREVYKQDFAFMFIDRIEKESDLIVKAQKYQRFIFTARVETVFRGRPWLEVIGLKPLPEHLTEPDLVHLVKAFRLKKARRFDAAAAEFQLAGAETLPTSIKAMTWREEGVCLAAADRFEDAMAPLARALEVTPKDKKLEKLLDQCRESALLVKKRNERSEESDADQDE